MTNSKSSNQVATKGDIKKLASRAELKRVESNLRSEILRVETRVEGLEDKVGTLDEKVEGLDNKLDKKFDNVISKLDGIAKGVDDLRTENIIGVHHTRELQAKVNNHEKRIKILESSTPAT